MIFGKEEDASDRLSVSYLVSFTHICIHMGGFSEINSKRKQAGPAYTFIVVEVVMKGEWKRFDEE